MLNKYNTIQYNTYSLRHTINFAVIIQNNSSTAIDNLFVDNGRINLSSISPIIRDLSDHDVQIVTIKNIYMQQQRNFL